MVSLKTSMLARMDAVLRTCWLLHLAWLWAWCAMRRHVRAFLMGTATRVFPLSLAALHTCTACPTTCLKDEERGMIRALLG